MGTKRSTRAFALSAPEPSEHQLQIACTDMLWRILLPDVQWTAIDHAHSLDQRLTRKGIPIGKVEAQKRKRRGIKPGIPDYLFWHQGRPYAIELKVGDGDLSPDQEEFCRGLIRAGAQLKVCWSSSQFMETISAWGLVRPGVRIAA